jgi:hypothetical protein
MEVISQPTVPQEKAERPGCLSEFGWFASGAILPIGSLSFYRRASKRPIGQAILFFFVFTIVISILSTIALGVPLVGFTQDIRNSYQRGEIPEITITNGIAEVDGPEPVILVNQYTDTGAMLVAVDTTGQITSIDESQYDQGLLITRTEFHVLNSDGRYQRLPLSQLNTMFQKDPLIINGETVSSAWVTIAIIITLGYLIFLFLWNSIARLMFIAMIALVLWGIGSLFRPKMAFGDFVIGGLYGIVPAIYLSHLLDRIGVSFIGLQTILLGVFWILALVACLSQEKFFSTDNPPRLWTALIGVPMLILLAVDLFVSMPSVYWKVALGVVAVLTVLILAGVRLYFHIRDMRVTALASPPSIV